MMNAIRHSTIVKPGGIIEICVPELPEGAAADVIVLVKDTPPKNTSSLSQFIGKGKGGFSTAKEADVFIRKERDSWES